MQKQIAHSREKTINYYPFHIGDYLSATRHLSWEEDAAFRRLLDAYYTTEKPLSADLRQVCRLVLATTDSQRQAVETVLGEFFQLTEHGWVNCRAEREIAEMQERQLVAKLKANKRWDKHRAELSKATAMPQHKENDAAASNSDADAMLPTPTPTPTPVLNTTAKAVGASRRKAQTQLQDDFSPNEKGVEAAKSKGLDVSSEFEKFKNYHLAKASVMADWQAAWRTWVGNARVPLVVVAQPKRGSDEYCLTHSKSSWWGTAGFPDVWNAVSAGCYHDTFERFSGGKRIKVVAA